MQSHEPSLFIPGPTEVFPEVLAQLARPLISHRGPEIAEMTFEIFRSLQLLFGTKHSCFVATCSATGIMEGAIRNLVTRRVLTTVCGAFSERQHKVALKNGKDAHALVFEPGHAVDPEAIDRELRKGGYEAVTVVHSETSTGVLNPLQAIGDVLRRYPEVFLIVDCVSSLGGAPVQADAWGADVVFAGTQKCLALPPGLAVFTVSDRAMKRAATITDRGHYFDFLNFQKMGEKGEMPATTCIPLVVALHYQLRRILAETTCARFARHAEMAEICRRRVEPYFPLYPDRRFMSPSLSVFANRAGVEVGAIVRGMQARGKLFANGYGELKEKNFRIGHMGDLTTTHLGVFLDLFDDVLRELKISPR